MTTIVKLAHEHYIVPETGVMYDRHPIDPTQMVVRLLKEQISYAYRGEAADALADYLESVAEKPEMGVRFCHEYDCKAKPPRAFTGEHGVALAWAAGWVGIENNWGEVASWYCPAHAPKQGDTNP